MQVETIAECSFGAFGNTFDLHKAIMGVETNFWSFLSGHFRQVSLHCINMVNIRRKSGLMVIY